MVEPTVEELTTEAALREASPVVEQLRPVGEERLLELVAEMRDEAGYRAFALRDDAVLAYAGVVVQTNLYQGRHAWVHDLVVDEPRRGRGHGSRLLSWLFEWAEERDCSCVELASGTWREDSHRFYESLDMERYCLTFTYDLSAETPY